MIHSAPQCMRMILRDIFPISNLEYDIDNSYYQYHRVVHILLSLYHNITVILERMSKYHFDLTDMTRTLTNLRIKIDDMRRLEVGDKIAFNSEGIMVIHKASYTQPIIRWLSGESRGLASEVLIKHLDDFGVFLKMMLVSRPTMYGNKDYTSLWEQCFAMLKNILHGLSTLLITYKNDSVYCDKLEPYKQQFGLLLREFDVSK